MRAERIFRRSRRSNALILERKVKGNRGKGKDHIEGSSQVKSSRVAVKLTYMYVCDIFADSIPFKAVLLSACNSISILKLILATNVRLRHCITVRCSIVMYETGAVSSHARSLWKLEHIRTKYVERSSHIQ